MWSLQGLLVISKFAVCSDVTARRAALHPLQSGTVLASSSPLSVQAQVQRLPGCQ
jgi:hypothetical protein